MAEILKNTGAKLWSMVDDHDELQSNVFDQLFGTGGKSDIRLIDEAIGKINESLNGYYFKIINDKLYICKDTESGTTSIPLSITDDNGHTALKVDGTSITIDGNGVVHGATIDDAFSLTSENAVQNKVVKAKFDEVDQKINANETTISSHKSDQNNPHNVTKSQLNLGNVEDKSSETIRSEITKENVTTALGYTPYTPNEVDNKFSTLETNIDWKEAVDTFADIAVAYPSPKDGWTVNVKNTDYTYRYNGSEWVAISANAIPKATDNVDGLLSKEDHAKYDDANSKKHAHDNKTSLDKLGESSEGNLTFNGEEIKAAQMTGATSTTDGVSGTVPAPKAGQEAHILNGDGTWASPLDNAIISAKIEELNQAIEDAKALKASLETYGMVQLNDTSVVTDSTGLALPSTEKNPNLEGTLANQISQLNTDLYNYTDVTEYKNTYVNIGSAFVYSKAGNKVTVQCYGTVNTDVSTNNILCGNFPAPLFGHAALTIVNQSYGTSGTLLINPSGNLIIVEEILKADNVFSICGNYICK